ncbi:MAG TPA: DUF6647 family protein [Rhizobiaceae bacterium]|nr:DUF6647 family protein [Rhizobiaceae bacterium]
MRALMKGLCVCAAATLIAGLAIALASAKEPADRNVISAVIRPASLSVAEDGDYAQLIQEIGAWLAAEFDLPTMSQPPVIRFASSKRMASLRFRDITASHAPDEEPEIVAVYDGEARTIYLPQGWTGRDAAEMSILVHELVHHMQKLAGQKFACPEMLEQLAYEAQERWLVQNGRDLMTDFGIDPFTLLVRTNCLY